MTCYRHVGKHVLTDRTLTAISSIPAVYRSLLSRVWLHWWRDAQSNLRGSRPAHRGGPDHALARVRARARARERTGARAQTQLLTGACALDACSCSCSHVRAENTTSHAPVHAQAVRGHPAGRRPWAVVMCGAAHAQARIHPQAILVTYDENVVSYVQLTAIYWHNIDPTDGTGQFCDKGLFRCVH